MSCLSWVFNVADPPLLCCACMCILVWQALPSSFLMSHVRACTSLHCLSWYVALAQASDRLGGPGSLRQVRDGLAAGGPGALAGGTPLAQQLAAWRARRGVALDITAHPGMELLSSKAGVLFTLCHGHPQEVFEEPIRPCIILMTLYGHRV